MVWKIKSRSDTDDVWAEYDKDGNETGKFHYDFKVAGIGEHLVHGAGIPKAVNTRRLVIAAVSGGVLAAGLVEVASHLLK